MENEKRKYKKHDPFDPFLPSKVPPQAIDIEEAILGAVLLEATEEHVQRIILKMDADHFYKFNNQIICQAIKDLHKESNPIDVLTVTEQLRKAENLENAGGTFYITMLTDRVSSSANIDYWFRIVYQKFLLREMIRIGSDKIRIAYEDSADCLNLLEAFIKDLEKLDPRLFETIATNAKALSKEMYEEFELMKQHHDTGIILPNMTYSVGWPRFDQTVTLGRDKIILIAGAAKSGKSRLIRAIMYILLELYTDISVDWVSLEDSRQDLLRAYLSTKALITSKNLKNRKYPKEKLPELEHYTKRFESFDIEFIDQTLRSVDLVNHFTQFCAKRKDRFNILIVDNILSLDDQMDFKFDSNGFNNYVMQNLLKCRQKTHGLIIALHHFNDAQQDRENLKTGYRPILKDIKGSETFRRTPNQVLMINSFNIYKDLMSEYSGDLKTLMNSLFVIDAGANREDSVNDNVSLIHLFTDMAYDTFWEIPLPPMHSVITPSYPIDQIDSHSIIPF